MFTLVTVPDNAYDESAVIYQLESADLVIYAVDGTVGIRAEDVRWIARLRALPAALLIVINKINLTTMNDARAIAQAAVTAPVTVMVNFSQRFLPDYVWIKRQLEAGEIGEPVMVISIKFDTIYVPTRMIGWADKTSPFYFMTSHDLDLVHWYLGTDPIEVVAQEVRGVLDAQGVPVHDGLNVLMRFAGGIGANFHSSWIHPTTYPVVADGSMQIIGSLGAITYHNRSRRAELYNPHGGQEVVFTGPQTATEVDGRLVGAFTESARHFLGCILEGREPITSPQRTLATAEAQAAALESLRTGQPVAVPM